MLDVLALIAKGLAIGVAIELLLVLAWCLWVTWRDRRDAAARAHVAPACEVVHLNDWRRQRGDAA